jgi:hypothetical protein
MSKKIIFFIIIVIQIFFTKISYAQFTNPLDSIFNEIGKGIENVTKSISEGVQKSDDKNVDIKNENKEIETKEIEKSVTTKSAEKKVDKKEYKPQCDNPKMAELLKQSANDKKSLKENSQVDKNISSSLKKRPPDLPGEITNEQWENLISTAIQRNVSFISISKNSFTNKFHYSLAINLNQAHENSLLVCARSGRGEGCEVVFDFAMLEANASSTNASMQNTRFNQNFNQTYSRDPLLNKFFESYNLYAQSTAILMEAYGKDQEAAIIRQSIIDAKNPNKGDQEKFLNSLTVVSEKGNNLKDLIYCRTEPLSADSKKKYEEAIPYAVKAVLTSVELKFMIGATAKNLKQAAQGDPLAAGLTALVYASYAPQVIEYLSSIGNTFSFILTGAKANNIEGSPKLQSTLKDL